MYVSMIQIIVDLPDIESIKDKRKIVLSLKDRIIRRFKISFAEIDLQDSLRFSQLGGAIVSNEKAFGEKVMQSVMRLVEDELPGRIHDVQIYTEQF